MNDTQTDPDQDDEVALTYEVSDEALEITSSLRIGAAPTLVNTYCFGCPAGAGIVSKRLAEKSINESDRSGRLLIHDPITYAPLGRRTL
jgi:hypothetical protein